jgi:hypothetical protein
VEVLSFGISSALGVLLFCFAFHSALGIIHCFFFCRYPMNSESLVLRGLVHVWTGFRKGSIVIRHYSSVKY